MNETVEVLKKGGVGVLPTDTLYGLVASVFSPEAVERLYTIKGRDNEKPFVILVSSLQDLKRFTSKVDQNTEDFLMENWPGPISVIVSVEGEEFTYLHRGKYSLAFREPLDFNLQSILKETGPLVAPSANPQGEEPARTISEAKKYFGDKVDFYIDGGELNGEPSTLVDVRNGTIEILRQGAYKLKEE